MQLETILQNITNDKIEKIYGAVDGKRTPIEGIATLEEIKSILIVFENEYRKKNVGTSLHRSYVSLINKLKLIFPQLDRIVRELHEGKNPKTTGADARNIVSNFHLLINSLKEVARSIDKNTK